MGQEATAMITPDIGMSKPSRELAAHITRELAWEERIEGSIFDSGPGLLTHRVYRLESLSSLLNNLASFSVDFGILHAWVGAALRDPDLARAIGEVLREPVNEDDEEAQAETRDAIAAIIEHRVAQCAEVLSDDAGSDDVADGDVETS